MSYYLSKILNIPFNEAETKVTEALKAEGFGILTEIDVKATLKSKLDVDFRPYKIFGACNPSLAHAALQSDDKIGTMLPCNVILQQIEDGVEVAAIDPVASMSAVNNEQVTKVAKNIKDKLKNIIYLL